MSHLHEDKRFDKFQTFSPDQPFKASYEMNGQQHTVIVQWMGEGKGVAPAYYVFADEERDEFEHPVLSSKELASLSDEQLREIFPNEKELNPVESILVIDYTNGVGWTERGKGKTEHAEIIGRLIEKHFGAA